MGQQQHDAAAVITIQGVKKAFDGHQVLDDFNLTIYRGENVVVLGRSGSGKSVLIKCIIGLLRPDSGSINVLGQDINALDEDGLDEMRMRVGFLFQSNALYDSMTVRENLEFPMRRHNINLDRREMNERVEEALMNVGLAHTIDMLPSALSGGMQKRIGLARTLILKPEIILYDEPTAGLDPVTGREITTLIMEIQRKYKASSVIISHDMHCVATTADRIAVLVRGKCYTEGSYETLKESTDPLIHQFFE